MRGYAFFSWLFAAALFAAGGDRVGARSAAQNRPAPAAGAARSVVLPKQLVCGASATLSVLDAAGRLVPGVKLETTGGEKLLTDATGRASFTAPAEPGRLVVHVEGRMIAASAPVVAGSDPAPDASAKITVTWSPRALEIRSRFELAGSGFHGNADEDRIALGEKQALVLASSPVSIVALPDPATPLGATTLSVEAGDQSAAAAKVVVVALDAVEPQSALRVGEEATFSVRVRGTPDPLAIEVSDLSPAILRLPAGNPLRLTTSGGTVNEAQFNVVPLAAGKYSIRANLAQRE